MPQSELPICSKLLDAFIGVPVLSHVILVAVVAWPPDINRIGRHFPILSTLALNAICHHIPAVFLHAVASISSNSDLVIFFGRRDIIRRAVILCDGSIQFQCSTWPTDDVLRLAFRLARRAAFFASRLRAMASGEVAGIMPSPQYLPAQTKTYRPAVHRHRDIAQRV